MIVELRERVVAKFEPALKGYKNVAGFEIAVKYGRFMEVV